MKFLLFLVASAALAQSTYQQRSRELIEYYAHPAGPGDSGFATVAAKLNLKEDPAWCSRRVLELLKPPVSGDMFWMFPITAVAFSDRGQLTEEARTAIKQAWHSYYPYRGDTENHWLLYYSTLFLMAEKWPNETGEFWFNGKSSAENRAEASAWIHSWMDLTTKRGQGEYDCTHYMGVYLLPMSYLAGWAEDPALKKRARTMLDYLIADYSVESLNGLFVGSHARTDDRQVLEKWWGVSSDFFWLLYGQGFRSGNGGYPLYYSLAANYEPPAILKSIATDRSTPYTHYELKRTRNRWRYHDERHGPVYKTTYMRKEYAVGSDQGGILQPVQQHSWDVTWALADPRGAHNTLFTVHPYSSNDELLTYFTFSPDSGTEGVVRSKKNYDMPDKLLGGSPYEKIFQDQDTVIVLYDIPHGARFPHINGFFSKDLSVLQEDASGWIFARGGDAWIAYRPLQPYSWKPLEAGGKRLFSPYLKNGAVVQVAPAGDYRDLAAFRQAILALPLKFQMDPLPSVDFKSLRGKQLSFTYGGVPRVDAKPLNYAAWPLFGGPFLEAAKDSGTLLLKYKNERLLVDPQRQK
jgi:hypothetical protein